jgi:hypothetical protein
MPIQIQLRRGTAASWTAANTLLAEGEMGLETDSGKFKVGDGTTAWISLPYSLGSVTLPTFSYGGPITVLTGAQRFYMDRIGTLLKFRASVGTAPVGSAIQVAFYKNGGATAIGTVSIPAGSFTATTTTFTSAVLAVGDYLTISVLAVGSSTPGSDLTAELSII